MATKIPAAQNRMFRNVFVCKNCSSKIRSEARKIIERKVKCRKCGGKAFRPIKKK
jgi:DNA-directed RNA polymerase subunit RPC12/RpoP